MKLAIISDIHGNLPALDAVLDDIAKERPDQIVCAGDLLDPLPTSREAWLKIKNLGIPMVRGNHEDYTISYHREGASSPIRNLIQFMPIAPVAESFSSAEVSELESLPLYLTIPGPGGHDVLVCHASLGSNKKGFIDGVDDVIAQELSGRHECVIVSGHWHEMKDLSWQGRTLICAGSVGIPLKSEPKAQYLILRYVRGEWKPEHRLIDYDHQATVKTYLESGFVVRGGPIGWLLLDEVLSQSRRLSPFFNWQRSRTPDHQDPPQDPAHDLPSWERSAQEFLSNLGRWEEIRGLIDR